MTRFWDGRTDRQTDGQTDGVTRPAFAFGDAGNKRTWSSDSFKEVLLLMKKA